MGKHPWGPLEEVPRASAVPMRGAGAGSVTRFCDPSAQGPSCCPQYLGDLCFVPARGSSCCVWLQPDLGTGAAGAEFPVRALGGVGQGCSTQLVPSPLPPALSPLPRPWHDTVSSGSWWQRRCTGRAVSAPCCKMSSALVLSSPQPVCRLRNLPGLFPVLSFLLIALSPCS